MFSRSLLVAVMLVSTMPCAFAHAKACTLETQRGDPQAKPEALPGSCMERPTTVALHRQPAPETQRGDPDMDPETLPVTSVGGSPLRR